MKLKALKSKNKYKSTSSWLDAVYRNNKDFIDQRLAAANITKGQKSVFKSLVKEYTQEGYSPSKALSIVNKSTIFTTTKERLVNNALSGIKSDKEAYKMFRELTKENGRYTKIDPNKFKWDANAKQYVYGDVRITLANSPKIVIVGY